MRTFTPSAALLPLLLAAAAGLHCSVQAAFGQMSFITQSRTTSLLGNVVSAPDFAPFNDSRNWFGATPAFFAQVGHFSTLSPGQLTIELTANTGNRGDARARFTVDFFALSGTTFSFGGSRDTTNNGQGSVIGAASYRFERIDVLPTVLFASTPSPSRAGWYSVSLRIMMLAPYCLA